MFLYVTDNNPKNTSPYGIILALSLPQILRAFRACRVCGSKDLYDLQPGTIRVTGSLELYFESNALYTDFRAENTVALQIVIGPGATGTYTLDMTSSKITSFDAPSQNKNFVTVTVQFESFVHATDTSLKITRTAS